MQGVVNDPKASDAIAKSVDTAKNRYLNTNTCEMSCAWSYVESHTYLDIPHRVSSTVQGLLHASVPGGRQYAMEMFALPA